MAVTRNADLVAATAELLLEKIQLATTTAGHPDMLKKLAEAFVLVAGADPARPPAAPRSVTVR